MRALCEVRCELGKVLAATALDRSRPVPLHQSYGRRLARHRHRRLDAVDTRELAVPRETRVPENPGKLFGRFLPVGLVV